ncbi:hypothetical protein B0A53_03641 [Rhodotorula sp. CCFEE 5036]|nr:hypothetical protein B0A53_03641 [Rhodotorula sp. CCFEE 5036]
MSSPAPPRVLVYGSVNCDEFFVVDHIVRTGETISSTSYSRGKGANQAVAAARAGSRVDFAGAIGSDGAWLKAELEAYGVDSRLLLQDEQYTHLLVQNEIPWTETLSVLSNAHAAGVITFLNPSPMPAAAQLSELKWADVDWLLINEGEGHDLLAASDQEASPEQLLSELRVALGGSTSILMTLGARGAVALLPDGTLVTAPAGKVVGDVKDTTGAGDCFTGYLATMIRERTPTAGAMKDVLARSCQAAAMCVEKAGAMESVPAMEEVLQRMGTLSGNSGQ